MALHDGLPVATLMQPSKCVRHAGYWCCALLALSMRGQSGAVADENERTIVLEAFRVNPGPIESFGFQTTPTRYAARDRVLVTAVIPNTAAAKAGLRPGDMIVSSDGEAVSAADGVWRGFPVPQAKKLAIGRGEDVAWTLQIRSHGPQEPVRTITLCLPTMPPRWGVRIWSSPERRAPATVPETGPLAERAKVILDNGVAIMLREDLACNLPRRSFYFGFQWSVGAGRTFVVSQVRGRTDIILQNGRTYYLTSPAAELERAVRSERVPQLDPWREIRVNEAEAPFRTEIDFWLNRVGKVSERWPLELIP